MAEFFVLISRGQEPEPKTVFTREYDTYARASVSIDASSSSTHCNLIVQGKVLRDCFGSERLLVVYRRRCPRRPRHTLKLRPSQSTPTTAKTPSPRTATSAVTTPRNPHHNLIPGAISERLRLCFQATPTSQPRRRYTRRARLRSPNVPGIYLWWGGHDL